MSVILETSLFAREGNMTGVILETSLFTREGNMTGVYLMKFQDCRTVATAVAARELDIKDVKHVVN